MIWAVLFVGFVLIGGWHGNPEFLSTRLVGLISLIGMIVCLILAVSEAT